MSNMLKELVSKNKIRYQKDGFDLDLAYITDKIIAMGFPAENLEGVYRNHMDDVLRFLEQKHGRNYKVYNLCLEKEYLPSKFKGDVAKFPFQDHNPPPFTLIKDFCVDVNDWLLKYDRHVAVIHCKAGKGRTGVMICSYLAWSKKMTADEALKLYGEKRTKDSKGVTIPSQRRYVHYFENMITRNLAYHPIKLRLVAFKFNTIPNFSATNHCSMYFVITWYDSNKVKCSCRYNATEVVKKSESDVVVELDHCCAGDIRVDIFFKTKFGKEAMFHLWFNTFFVNSNLKSEPVDWNKFNKIPSRISHDNQFSSTALTSSNEGNTNSNKTSTISNSCCNDGNCANLDQKKIIKPELKKELLNKVLLFMQKKHKVQLASDPAELSQNQVLTSYKPINTARFNPTNSKYLTVVPEASQNVTTVDQRPLSPKLSPRLQKKTRAISRDENVATNSLKQGNPEVTYKILTMKKIELDKAHKDKQHKIFPSDFFITLYFLSCDEHTNIPSSPNCSVDDDDDGNYTEDTSGEEDESTITV